MRLRLFIYTVFTLVFWAASAFASQDTIDIKGTACEKFADSLSRSSVRVRVTDKASYNAVSSIKDLAELRSTILDHDFNVIVYNLVDNYVQDLTVRTVNQSPDELCVEVTGAVPATDIVNVIANYSAVNPAPEYDFKAANGIKEEKLVVLEDELKETKQPEPEAEVLYQSEEGVEPESESEVLPETPAVKMEDIAERKAAIYIAPVEFYNNTHSAKPVELLKEMFGNAEVYRLVDSYDQADYALLSKVLKAKVDPVNAHTKRLHMVVSIELKTLGTDVSAIEHQNRFVLFDASEKEQDVAQALLKRLLRKAGENLFKRVDNIESKKHGLMPAVITPVSTL